MEVTLQTIIARLEELFIIFNNKFYDGKLETPVIAVSPDPLAGSYGWCSVGRIWQKEGTEGYREINLCAEHLTRPITETSATLLHEMVHLWNLQNGVKDTSRGNSYHNKKFKTEAELRGLLIEHDHTYGWTKTNLNEETEKWITSEFGNSKFDLCRMNRFMRTATAEAEEGEEGTDEPKKKTGSRKYVCPTCGMIVRATKEVNVDCGDCREKMVEETK